MTEQEKTKRLAAEKAKRLGEILAERSVDLVDKSCEWIAAVLVDLVLPKETPLKERIDLGDGLTKICRDAAEEASRKEWIERRVARGPG